MIVAGHILSGLGLLLFLIGAGYWAGYSLAFQKNRFAVVRNRSNWHLLGNLTIIGMLVYVAGRAWQAFDREQGKWTG